MNGPIVLIRLGEPILPSRSRIGPYEMWFQRAIEEPLGVVDLRDPEQDVPEDAAATIVMGSPLAVYDPHPWLPRALEVARRLIASGRPTLGVCFGHQLFCVASGGEVRRNRCVEVGTVDVTLAPEAASDPLFGGFGGKLHVNASHDDTIVALPTPAPQVLGRSARDAHQVLRWGPRAWSVQFHPEMRGLETRLAVDWRQERIVAEGCDPAAVRAAVDDAPDGLALLARFVRLVREGE
ncbi:MAG: type 1 glutamine amidotransferase [Planctomycetota bacterium]